MTFVGLTDSAWGAAAVILAAFAAAVPATIAAWNSRRTKRELQPNGGESAFDKINRQLIGIGVTMRATEDALAHRVEMTESRMQARLDTALEDLNRRMDKADDRLKRVEQRQVTAEDVSFRVDARTAAIESKLTSDGDEDNGAV